MHTSHDTLTTVSDRKIGFLPALAQLCCTLHNTYTHANTQHYILPTPKKKLPDMYQITKPCLPDIPCPYYCIQGFINSIAQSKYHLKIPNSEELHLCVLPSHTPHGQGYSECPINTIVFIQTHMFLWLKFSYLEMHQYKQEDLYVQFFDRHLPQDVDLKTPPPIMISVFMST